MIEFEFITIVLFIEIALFRLNTTEWIWSKYPDIFQKCSFCHGFWIGFIVWLMFYVGTDYNLITVFKNAVIHGMEASLLCLTYNALVLKEN